MTVVTTTSRADYTGNGVTTAFTVPFYFLDNTHLSVLKTVIATGVSTTQILGSNYTVTGAGVPAGGTVTMTVAPTALEKISILRSVPLTQDTDYVENDPFPAASHERALDKLTMEIQQVTENLARTVTIPASDDVTSMVLPTKVTRANNILSFDSAGSPTVVTGLSSVAVNAVMVPFVQATSIASAYNLLVLPASVTTVKIADANVTPAKMASSGAEFEARNYLTNGAMAIDQRNIGNAVSLATTSKWALDQWAARQATATPNVTTQRVASGIANTPFALKVLRSSGADTTAARVIQVLSSEESWPLAGKTITVSFQLLKGSACSNTTLSFFIYTGTGTDQTVTQLEAGSWTGVANTNPLNLAFSGVTTSFAQYSFTTTVPSNASQLALVITNNAYSGSGSANDFYTITDICLTPTTTVVPVPRRHPDQELVLCEKYYQKSYDLAILPGSVTSLGVHQTTAATAFILANGTVYFKKRFRATPTVTIYSPNSGTSGVAGEYNTGGTFVADRAVGSTFIGQTTTIIQVSGTATVGNDIRFHWTADAGLL